MKSLFGERVLIFGGTGSLGKKLIERLGDYASSNEVSVYSRDELKQWTIKNDLSNSAINKPRFFVGDIRDYSRIKDVIDRKSVV